MAPKRKVIPSSLASQSSQRASQRDEDDYESEEEAEVIPSNNRKRKATQGNSRAKKPKATQEPPNFNLLEQEEEHLLGSLMRFCLFKDTNKLPIKKDDMTATVLGEKYKGRKGLLDSLLKKASERFVKIFGFELVEIERHDTNADVTTKSSTATQKQKKKSSGIWILRLLPADHGLPLYDMSKKELKQASSNSIQRKRRDFSFDGLEQSQIGLLMVLVCLIQIRKNRLDEEEMWKLLSKLGIEKGHHHSVFGLPEKLIQQFEKQFYIEKNKDELGMKTKEHTNTLYIYQHGSRLRKELLDMDQILNFLTEVTGSAVDKATHTEFRNMHGVDDESEEEEVVGPTPTPPRR